MKKILILFGGNSHEHEISCLSANFIKQNIDNKLFTYELIGIDYDNSWYKVDKLKDINIDWKNNIIEKIDNVIEFIHDFDKILPVIHGNTCEDGKLQSIFELYNLKYVGCNSYSSLICYDKFLTKIFLEKYNIEQIPYKIYSKNNIKNIKYPVIVKPCKCGSSIGIGIAKNKKELIKNIKIAKKYDDKIIIEKYIENKREFECAILKHKNKLYTSDIGEILNNGSWYDYNSKYKEKINTCIADINNEFKNNIKNISKKIFQILNCKNMARIDFLYDLDNKKLYFNEINTIPGFTDISMYPKLINELGINYKKLITLLLQ